MYHIDDAQVVVRIRMKRIKPHGFLKAVKSLLPLAGRLERLAKFTMDIGPSGVGLENLAVKRFRQRQIAALLCAHGLVKQVSG